MSVGWLSPSAPVYPGMHHQPGRLARTAAVRSPLTLDRMQGIDGLGNLGQSTDFSTDEEYEAELENDTDYAALVSEIIKAAGKITPAVIALATQVSSKKKFSLDSVLGLAQGRATAVQTGQASAPGTNWTLVAAIGAGALVVLALVMRR